MMMIHVQSLETCQISPPIAHPTTAVCHQNLALKGCCRHTAKICLTRPNHPLSLSPAALLPLLPPETYSSLSLLQLPAKHSSSTLPMSCVLHHQTCCCVYMCLSHLQFPYAIAQASASPHKLDHHSHTQTHANNCTRWFVMHDCWGVVQCSEGHAEGRELCLASVPRNTFRCLPRLI